MWYLTDSHRVILNESCMLITPIYEHNQTNTFSTIFPRFILLMNEISTLITNISNTYIVWCIFFSDWTLVAICKKENRTLNIVKIVPVDNGIILLQWDYNNGMRCSIIRFSNALPSSSVPEVPVVLSVFLDAELSITSMWSVSPEAIFVF